MNKKRSLSRSEAREVYFAALLSRHVYPSRNFIEKELDRQDVGVIDRRAIADASTGTYVEAFVTDETVYIVPRGTESIRSLSGWRDWLTNILGFKRRFHGIRAHYGFASAASSVLPSVEEIIDLYRDRRIVLAGHSLGGAIAALLAVAIVRQIREACLSTSDLSLITFGQPRVAARRHLGLALLGMVYLRIQNGSDAISGLPPPILYGHGGRNIYFPNDAKHRGYVLDSPSYLDRFKDRLFTFRKRISDHSATAFVEKARGLLAALDPEFIEELATRRAKILTRG